MNRIFALDLRSLAALRVTLGALILYDLVDRARDLTFYYTDLGVLPRYMVVEEYWNPVWWCLHLYSGTVAGTALLFLLHGLAAVALMLGWRARIASIACYLLALSLLNRNPLIIDSSDRLFVILLFWGVFLPWESRYSLDAKARPKQFESADVVVVAGGIGYMLQVTQMYWMAGLWKMHPVWLTERTALYRALKMEQVTKPLGYWLLGHPTLMEVLSLGTVCLEFFGPILLLLGNNRARLIGVAAFACLHAGIALTMDLEFFPLVSLTVLVGLLPSCAWPSPPRSGPKLGPAARWADRAWVQWAAILAIIGTLGWNMLLMRHEGTLPEQAQGRNAWPAQMIAAFRLTQFWTLFAPVPRPFDSRYVVEAKLSDNSTVDLLRSGNPVSWKKPDLPSAEFRNQRQRVHLNGLELSFGATFRLRTIRRMAIEWNQAHPERKVRWLRMVVIRTDTRVDGLPAAPYANELAWAVPRDSDWMGPLWVPLPMPGPPGGEGTYEPTEKSQVDSFRIQSDGASAHPTGK